MAGASVSFGGGGALADPADVWWQPGSDLPRVFFLARLHAACTTVLASRLDMHGILALLGKDVFSFDLLHQSLSDRYADTPEIRRRLLLAGASVRAQAFTLTLDRLQCASNDRGSRNVDVRMHGGCGALEALVQAINGAIAQHGLPMGGGHTPHITISYGFRGVMPRTRTLPSVDVTIDAFELVVGGGTPYSYTTLGKWPLAPQTPPTLQPQLF